MSAVNATLKGFAGLEARLKLLGDDVATKIGQAANRAGAVLLLARVKAAAPVGPTPEGAQIIRNTKKGSRTETHHKIRNNLKVIKKRTFGQNAVSNSITVGKAYQASFVEFGSIRQAPNPFMRNALENNQDEAIAKIAAIIEKRLTKMGV